MLRRKNRFAYGCGLAALVLTASACAAPHHAEQKSSTQQMSTASKPLRTTQRAPAAAGALGVATTNSTLPHRLAARPAAAPRTAGTRAPVIVIDPGHSVAISRIDRRTGLNVSDYENEPEMRDVWRVALIVQRRLRALGYRVVMTKKRLYAPTDLAQRARLANRVGADLALSIHDQAGRNGGIGFQQGNNIVYYQSVGTYRETSAGRKWYFTNQKVAGLSRHYGRIFRRQRQAYEGHRVTVRGNVGYNLGSRGLAPGNIWMVQLLSHVPWIYNEVGGNSAGRVGLDRRDKRRYARGLIQSVEHCIAPPGR